jgi:triacylglycerol lipase
MMWMWVLFKEFYFVLKTVVVSPRSFFPIEWKKPKGKTPVLLIHGYLNRASIWLYMGKKLSKKDFGSIYTLNLKKPLSSIEEFAKQIKEKAKQIEKKEGTNKLIIVAHSMGGLASLYYALHLTENQNLKLITLGTPFKGTAMGALGIGKCAKQMKRDSAFLKELQGSYKKNKSLDLYHIATKKDQIILPYTSCFISSDKNRHYLLDNIGHMELVYIKAVFKKMAYWINCD